MAAPRPRQRRRTGDQLSKQSDKLAALAGSKCIASVIRDEQGSSVCMILMADNCPACVEAKRQLQRVSRPRPAPFRTRPRPRNAPTPSR